MLAWFLATGCQWELVQVYAWARMFVGYAADNTLTEALELTFDPDNACELCQFVEQAQDEKPDSEQSAPGNPRAPKPKMPLICQQPARIHFPDTRSLWDRASWPTPASWSAPPPTPPPRNPA